MSDSNRVAVLYAAPLVFLGDDGTPHAVDVLDFESERKMILDSLKKCGRPLEISFQPATRDSFRETLTLGCNVLHYSGHGNPGFLAFEDDRGQAHPLDPATLRRLFAAGGTKADLVFVSACHSRAAGQAFVGAGVPHVVAIKLDAPVYDRAARDFAHHFYMALASGKTVREAFDVGRAIVAADPELADAAAEADKFLLMPANGGHNVQIFAGSANGNLEDSSAAPPRSKLPSVAEHFTGRAIDMQGVLDLVLSARLTTLRGAPGIGKTALAIATGHYLNERRKFSDGIFFADIRGAISPDAARVAISGAVGVEVPDDEALFRSLARLDLLVILDNCEDVLNRAASGFRKFVSRLLQEAHGVKLLITSRQAVGPGIPGVAEKVHHLRRLSD
ncbi:MAG: CHAT domain-containing protein, partial [Blastocatellia bacterium]